MLLGHPQWDALSDALCTAMSAFYPPPIPPAMGRTIARPKRRPKHLFCIYIFIMFTNVNKNIKQIKTTQLKENSNFT